MIPSGALPSVLRQLLLCSIFLLLTAVSASCNREQVADKNFDTKVAHPAYTTERPKVIFDEAHLNAHKAAANYKPFVDLIRNDGYDVQPNRDPFAAERLAGVSILVIVLARGDNDANDAPAFTELENDAVDRWIRSGGSLLLVTDHWPFGSAAGSLGRRFGVEVSNGMVEDPMLHEPSRGASHIIFSRKNGLLRDHSITVGRSAVERVERVLTFTGTSLRGPADAAELMSLSETAIDYPASTATVEKFGDDTRVSMNYGDPVSAARRVQGLALEVGKGRVVVIADAGMLSAQVDDQGRPVGMNFPGYDNRQLVLNIMHWLSGIL